MFVGFVITEIITVNGFTANAIIKLDDHMIKQLSKQVVKK